MARRIQRQRTKDWRMPVGAVYVGRPSRWGNPIAVGTEVWFQANPSIRWITDREGAVGLYRHWLTGKVKAGELVLAPLRGLDLACWCRLCDAHADGKPLGVECPDCAPCHADVLLELANS